MLNDHEQDRYQRQVLCPLVGEAGQARLLQSRVAVAGCGAIGTATAEMLARGGVGYLRLIDPDQVELSNLQRQTLFEEADIAAGPKAAIAAATLGRINSDITIQHHVARVEPGNALELLADVDVVIDAVDNFAGKFAINRAAVTLGLPVIYAALAGTLGVVMPILPGQTACLSCLYGEEPDRGSSETAATAGVIGPIVNMVASLQAAQAMKIILGAVGDIPEGLIQIEAWDTELHIIPTRRREECCVCGAL